MRVFSPRVLNAFTAIVMFSIVTAGIYSLVRSGQPSADVIAAQDVRKPMVDVSDFQSGDVKIVTLIGLPIIVWRRNAADMALAESQNQPSDWHNQYSNVYGQLEPVHADDGNVTLESEWFFALAQRRNGDPFYPVLRAGDYGGFFDVKFASHYDLSGRYRSGLEVDNLTIIAAEFTAYRQQIRLDMSGSKWPPLSY